MRRDIFGPDLGFDGDVFQREDGGPLFDATIWFSAEKLAAAAAPFGLVDGDHIPAGLTWRDEVDPSRYMRYRNIGSPYIPQYKIKRTVPGASSLEGSGAHMVSAASYIAGGAKDRTVFVTVGVAGNTGSRFYAQGFDPANVGLPPNTTGNVRWLLGRDDRFPPHGIAWDDFSSGALLTGASFPTSPLAVLAVRKRDASAGGYMEVWCNDVLIGTATKPSVWDAQNHFVVLGGATDDATGDAPWGDVVSDFAYWDRYLPDAIFHKVFAFLMAKRILPAPPLVLAGGDQVNATPPANTWGSGAQPITLGSAADVAGGALYFTSNPGGGGYFAIQDSGGVELIRATIPATAVGAGQWVQAPFAAPIHLPAGNYFIASNQFLNVYHTATLGHSPSGIVSASGNLGGSFYSPFRLYT